jgi:hypothetical protein
MQSPSAGRGTYRRSPPRARLGSCRRCRRRCRRPRSQTGACATSGQAAAEGRSSCQYRSASVATGHRLLQQPHHSYAPGSHRFTILPGPPGAPPAQPSLPSQRLRVGAGPSRTVLNGLVPERFRSPLSV